MSFILYSEISCQWVKPFILQSLLKLRDDFRICEKLSGVPLTS